MILCVIGLTLLQISFAVRVDYGNPNAFEGDIGLDPYTRSMINGDLTPSQAFKGTRGRIWDGAVIPYVFDRYFDSRRRTLMNQAMEDYHRKTCVRFRQRTNEYNYVLMVNQNACWSIIGRGGGKQLLKMGNNCLQLGTAKHELMHAVGFYHEQSRNDRDTYVNIFWNNIQNGQSYNFQKYNTNYYGQSYDLNSIMHYRNWEFSFNRRDTIQAKSNSGLRLGNLNFSQRDLNAINAMYRCNGNTGVNPNPSLCKDNNTNCPAWQRGGYCTKRENANWMSVNCKKSCNKC